MTNFEKFGKELNSTGFGVVNGKPLPCNKLTCSSCEFNPLVDCSYKKMDWLKAEYKEPKINIPEDTPIDAKVIVSNDGITWDRRYYAGKKNDKHYAWYNGKTSWSANPDRMGSANPDRMGSWEYMKLYNEEGE